MYESLRCESHEHVTATQGYTVVEEPIIRPLSGCVVEHHCGLPFPCPKGDSLSFLSKDQLHRQYMGSSGIVDIHWIDSRFVELEPQLVFADIEHWWCFRVLDDCEIADFTWNGSLKLEPSSAWILE